MEALIAYNANVNAKDTKGNTALHMAAWQERDGSQKVAEILLQNGAEVNAVNEEVRRPEKSTHASHYVRACQLACSSCRPVNPPAHQPFLT